MKSCTHKWNPTEQKQVNQPFIGRQSWEQKRKFQLITLKLNIWHHIHLNRIAIPATKGPSEFSQSMHFSIPDSIFLPGSALLSLCLKKCFSLQPVRVGSLQLLWHSAGNATKSTAASCAYSTYDHATTCTVFGATKCVEYKIILQKDECCHDINKKNERTWLGPVALDKLTFEMTFVYFFKMAATTSKNVDY